ncbi:MAG: PdxA family dehydrogenase [Deltaproteobacteria bacterium]
MSLARVAVTMGDPAGIGPEVLVKALRRLRRSAGVVFYVVGDGAFLRRRGVKPSARVRLIDAAEGSAPAASLRYLEAAADLLGAGVCSALVTAPVSKEKIQASGVPFSGHTEFLMRRFGVRQAAMVFAGTRLRIALATRHVSLRAAVRSLDRSRIAVCGRLAAGLLRTHFGIARPRIAVCGLNPHAGEGGLFGDEEARHIVPAIRLLNKGSRAVFSGPWPADTVIHHACRGAFDLVLTMYHDQGLPAFKALEFATGAQVTAGLPFVRTSPVHGTAFDIAGKGIADAGSMETALRLACDLLRTRRP